MIRSGLGICPVSQSGSSSLAHTMRHWCRKFLRRHIQQYLQKHMYMPPKSIVLVASLKPADKGAPAPAIKADTEQRLQRTQVRSLPFCKNRSGVLMWTPCSKNR